MTQKTTKVREETAIEMTDEIRALNSMFTPEAIETGVLNREMPPVPEGDYGIYSVLDPLHDALFSRSIGKLMHAARQAAGKKLSDIADELEWSDDQVEKLEAGNANLSVAVWRRAAKAYGFGLEVRLLPDNGEKPAVTVEMPDYTPDALK